jgi:membrane fusion protein, multidrug efflux system
MKSLIYTLPVLSILFVSCGENSTSENDKNLATSTDSTSLPKVEVAMVTQGLFEHYYEVQGTLESDNNTLLTPEVPGKIVALNVKEGQMISEGAVIAIIDQSVISSNIQELEKNLELAKYLYEKQKTLYDQGVGTELQLKQAQANYESLKQTKQTLSTQQGKYVLKAPFTGYVEEIFPVVGEIANPAMPIVRLISLDKLKVVADVSEVYLKSTQINSKVNVIFPAIDDTIKATNITRMGKFINPANRTIDVEVNIPSKDKYIPNLMAVLKIRDYVDTSALMLPTESVLEDSKGNSFVFVVNKDGSAVKTLINVGHTYNGFTEVKSGVVVNNKVVIKGARKLVNNEKVSIEN